MKWFRSKIRHGSRLALLALAIQFALSFGHFHPSTAQAGLAVQPDFAPFQLSHDNGLTAPDADAGLEPASHPAPDRQPADRCAICAVLGIASAVLFAAAPILLLPQAVEFLYLVTDAEFVHLNSAGFAFQARAPPVS